MQWMLLPLRRYADFSGRSRRKEYWLFALGHLLVYVALVAVFFVSGGTYPARSDVESTGFIVLAIVLILVTLGLIIPSVALHIRRFHDQDRSGWMLLLTLIPYVGNLIILVFMCLDGTPGENRFGPDPKGRGDDERYEDIFGGPDLEPSIPRRPQID